MARRRLAATCTSLIVFATFVGITVPADATLLAPTYFPAGVTLDSNAYVLQFAGANREATAAAVDLDAALAGGRTAGYPYATASGVSAKSDRSKLYGPAVCPTAVVLAADDTPADALAAASLRGHAALPLTNDAGSTVRVDTSHTDLMLTQSGREGATTLDSTTAAALTRVRAACPTTIHGIVLGGTYAIPPEVYSDFASRVTDTVRVSGPTRFDTAALIARAVVATETTLPTVNYYPTPSVRGAAFTNGKASFTSAAQQSLAQTVFLAEGGTGADALAIGPLAASLGVPILLTDASNLPDPTQSVLRSLAPTTVVVLGGSFAIGDGVLDQVRTVTESSARLVRIAGPNRFATSVDIAKQLFNIYPEYGPTFGAAAFSDQVFGLARDQGTAAGGDHVGWPDALAASYDLADASGGGFAAPARAAPPVEVSSGSTTQVTIGGPTAVCGSAGSACYPTIPLLLTGGSSLVLDVDAYLQALYPRGGAYKVGGSPASSTNEGGFALVFGGGAAVSPATRDQLALDLSGQTYTPARATDLSPSLAVSRLFVTRVNLSDFVGPAKQGTTPVFTSGASADPKVCVTPGGLTGAAGLAALDQSGSASLAPQPAEYFQASSTPYPDRLSLGACLSLANGASLPVNAYAVGLSGHESASQAVNFAASDEVVVSTLAGPVPATGTGSVFIPIPQGPSETQSVSLARTADPVTYKGTSYPGATITFDATITRTNANAGMDLISWKGSLVGYADKTTTQPLFAFTVTSGYADATPSSGLPGVLTGTLHLLGVSNTGVQGAVVLGLSGGVLGTTVTNLEASGIAS
ncbi:MAG: cell wall-binding repeat-containing protein [Acidimicrobiales bacterium]